MSFAIETIGLTKYFSRFCALKNINLKVTEGDILGLVGPNGAGKTTLLRILSTLILPTSGECYINGYSVYKDKDMEKIKSSINLVSDEERSFYWRLTGRQNLRFFARLYDISSWTMKQRIEETAGLLEMETHLDKMFKDYSSGMKQKLAIARSLINNPRVILMDEPTRNLDLKTRRRLYSFIKKELVGKEKISVILASHQLDEVAQVSTHIAIIDKGEIAAQGTLDELRRNYPAATSLNEAYKDEGEGASLDEIFIAAT